MISKATLIHSLRIAIATLIAALVGEKLGVGHIYWMMFTVVLVLQAELGSSIKKSTQRIVGTLIGAPIGIVLIMMIGEYNTVSITSIMALSIVVIILMIKKNYAIAVTFITIAVLMGYGLLGDTNLTDTALQRIIDTLAGTFIAVLTAIIVFPSSINSVIMDEWVRFLKTSGDVCLSVADGILGKTTPKDIQNTRKNYLKDVDELTRRGAESAWEFSIFGNKSLPRELRENIIKTPILLANR
ncbi:MAG: FUSC family protein, partial [Campylobacterales bacterium]